MVLDLAQLTAPIEGDSAVGVDLRLDEAFDSPFRRVKDLRGEARETERQALESTETDRTAATSQWLELRDLAADLLSNQTKDLELATYLLEALVRTDGFEGVHAGIQLIEGLVDQFWDSLFPEKTALRAKRLSGIAGQVAQAIQWIPLTEGPGHAYWQYQWTTELSEEELEEAKSRGAITQSEFRREVDESSDDFLRRTYSALTACHDAALALSKTFNEHSDSPVAMTSLAGSLDDCRRVIKGMAEGRLEEPPPPEEEETATAEESKEAAPAAAAPKSELNTREDAFRMMERVADFIERTEPQSLLPAHIRKIVRWGRLPPQEYYSVLIQDSAALEQVFTEVGLRTKGGDSGGE